MLVLEPPRLNRVRPVHPSCRARLPFAPTHPQTPRGPSREWSPLLATRCRCSAAGASALRSRCARQRGGSGGGAQYAAGMRQRLPTEKGANLGGNHQGGGGRRGRGKAGA
jgi:hypothetical protein